MRAKEIRELVKIVEESQVGELEITYWWGRKVRISKPAASSQGSHGAAVEIVAAAAPAAFQAMPHHAPTLPTPPPAPAPAEASEPAGNLLEIKAPMVGTFYRASSPDAEAYIREGDRFAPGKVLCIIEAMKLMNEIEAETTGKIVKILVENGKAVEYNQPLFLVDPAG